MVQEKPLQPSDYRILCSGFLLQNISEQPAHFRKILLPDRINQAIHIRVTDFLRRNAVILPVHPRSRDIQIRLADKQRALRRRGKLRQHLSDAFGKLRSTRDAVRNIRTKRKRQLLQLLIRSIQPVQPPQKSEHRCCICAAARHSGRNRNSLIQMNPKSSCKAILPAHDICRPPDQILRSGRNFSTVCCQLNFIAFRLRNRHGIADIHSLHHHSYQVISILPFPGHIQIQVDFSVSLPCDFTHSRILRFADSFGILYSLRNIFTSWSFLPSPYTADDFRNGVQMMPFRVILHSLQNLQGRSRLMEVCSADSNSRSPRHH